MIVLLLVLLGLAFGSFVNALVWRLHKGKDWVRGRSECSRCHHPLAPKDLIPVLSWLALGGKCRYCRQPIVDSPLVEIITPVLFVASYLFWPQPLAGAGLFHFVFWLICLVGFMALAVYDLKWFLLPDVIVFPLLYLVIFQVAAGSILFEGSWQALGGPLIGAAVISGLFYAIYWFSKGAWIGFGDVKLGLVLGLLAGGAIPALLVLLVASLLGTLIALPLLFLGRAHRKSHLPFGPLLICGIIVVRLFGNSIIDGYMRLLGL